MSTDLPDDLEVIVPGIDYIPEWGEAVVFTLRYRGRVWSIYTADPLTGRVGVVCEGTTWSEPITAEWLNKPIPHCHIHSASSISRAFIPAELFPYIEALLKLHA